METDGGRENSVWPCGSSSPDFSLFKKKIQFKTKKCCLVLFVKNASMKPCSFLKLLVSWNCCLELATSIRLLEPHGWVPGFASGQVWALVNVNGGG